MNFKAMYWSAGATGAALALVWLITSGVESMAWSLAGTLGGFIAPRILIPVLSRLHAWRDRRRNR